MINPFETLALAIRESADHTPAQRLAGLHSLLTFQEALANPCEPDEERGAYGLLVGAVAAADSDDSAKALCHSIWAAAGARAPKAVAALVVKILNFLDDGGDDYTDALSRELRS